MLGLRCGESRLASLCKGLLVGTALDIFELADGLSGAAPLNRLASNRRQIPECDLCAHGCLAQKEARGWRLEARARGALRNVAAARARTAFSVTRARVCGSGLQPPASSRIPGLIRIPRPCRPVESCRPRPSCARSRE